MDQCVAGVIDDKTLAMYVCVMSRVQYTACVCAMYDGHMLYAAACIVSSMFE